VEAERCGRRKEKQRDVEAERCGRRKEKLRDAEAERRGRRKEEQRDASTVCSSLVSDFGLLGLLDGELDAGWRMMMGNLMQNGRLTLQLGQ
jgi:hypothetical protein